MSAVMNTVLPARDSPVTPSLIVGSNSDVENSAKARPASRICSRNSNTVVRSTRDDAQRCSLFCWAYIIAEMDEEGEEPNAAQHKRDFDHACRQPPIPVARQGHRRR